MRYIWISGGLAHYGVDQNIPIVNNRRGLQSLHPDQRVLNSEDPLDSRAALHECLILSPSGPR
jgi:hypothetical protein